MNNNPLGASFDATAGDENFSDSILSPSVVKKLWGKFKVKQGMVDYLTWYFRPASSYDPERVDYNCINIFAEYQTYNLEFCKNELFCNDRQTANILDMFWQLLEFNPDADVSKEDEQKGGDNVRDEDQMHDKSLEDESRDFTDLLKHKVDLLKDMITGQIVAHQDKGARLSGEQARRLVTYTQQTFFKHLRLYDYMLKNTKLSENKYINVSKQEPNLGSQYALSNAMVIDDKRTEYYYEQETPSKTNLLMKQIDEQPENEVASGNNGEGQKEVSDFKITEADRLGSAAKSGNNAGGDPTGTEGDARPKSDKDEQDEMSERLRSTGLDFDTKKVIHKSVNKWADKFSQLATNEDAIEKVLAASPTKK